MLLIDNKAIFVHIPRTGGSFTRQVINSANLNNQSIGGTHGSIAKKDIEDYYTFGYVRNPYAWHVSIFLQFSGGLTSNAAFKSYLRNHIEPYAFQKKYYQQFFQYQKLAVNVFKTEELEQSLNFVFDKFNWTKPDELLNMTPVNTRLHTQEKTYQEYYDDKTKKLVYESNRDIIEKYDYKF